MQLSIEQQIKLLLKEVKRYKLHVTMAFCVIAMAALILGVISPDKYVSYAQILSEEQNIINPLMEGRASTPTGNQRDRVAIAKELLFNKKIMDEVLRTAGLINDSTTPIQREAIVNAVQHNTKVSRVGNNNFLIRIEYSSTNPQQSYVIAKKFSEAFIDGSMKDKQKQALDAFNSIEGQVKEYHQRLVDAEERLKEIRTGNINATPGNETEVNTRISTIRQRIEQARLDLHEAEIRQKSIEDQLSGEAESSFVFTRENQFRTRIGELQSELDTLRLSYHETYPDIVRIKHQIEDLKEAISNEKNKKETAKVATRGNPRLDDSVTSTPLYQQLRTQLSQTKTLIATLHSRITENESLLNQELSRARQITDVEASLAELTRDYNVNRTTYQDLSQRRENARLSLNLTMEQQGPTLRIEEPARVPVSPTGPQFIHYAMAGIVLGIVLPIGFIYLMMTLDIRILSESVLTEKYKLPILANIPYFYSLNEKIHDQKRNKLIIITISCVFVVYVVVTLLKLKKII